MSHLAIILRPVSILFNCTINGRINWIHSLFPPLNYLLEQPLLGKEAETERGRENDSLGRIPGPDGTRPPSTAPAPGRRVGRTRKSPGRAQLPSQTPPARCPDRTAHAGASGLGGACGSRNPGGRPPLQGARLPAQGQQSRVPARAVRRAPLPLPFSPRPGRSLRSRLLTQTPWQPPQWPSGGRGRLTSRREDLAALAVELPLGAAWRGLYPRSGSVHARGLRPDAPCVCAWPPRQGRGGRASPGGGHMCSAGRPRCCNPARPTVRRHTQRHRGPGRAGTGSLASRRRQEGLRT